MPIVLNGSSGIVSGNIADGTITAADLAPGAARGNFGSGAVLQVIQSVKTDTFSTGVGGVWGDIPGLSASITPSSTTSRILIMVDVKCSGQAGSSVVRSRILRNSTPVYVGDGASSRPQAMGQFYIGSASDNVYYMAQIGGTFLDSPSTTSSITYRIQIGADGNTQVVYVNRTNSDRDNPYYDARGASSITLMEISG